MGGSLISARHGVKKQQGFFSQQGIPITRLAVYAAQEKRVYRSRGKIREYNNGKAFKSKTVRTSLAL